MEYRKLPKGNDRERFSALGIGLGAMENTPEEEIEAIIRKAMDHGINFFDLCAGGARAYAPFGRAIRDRREQVFFQLHFGAVYNEAGAYGWSRDFERIRDTFWWEMEALGTDYADFGFLHCIDAEEDLRQLVESGVLDFVKDLKAKGTLRHLGFSSHTPSVSQKLMDILNVDMILFSINPAYDFEKGDEYGIGTQEERSALFRRCQAEGVGISVMKPFHGGKLLSAEQSPFGQALNHYQCLQYAMDRPGVLSVVPGVQTMAHLDTLLGFDAATQEEKDYSVIGTFTADTVSGSCVYCSHCQPCPAGIEIGLVNKYYDLARAGDAMAANHYRKLAVQADACMQCGHCDSRCPFGVEQGARMGNIAEYFSVDSAKRS